MPTKQAAAAVGQCELMYIYDKLFSEYHHNVAQLLITNDNFSEEDRYSNFINTLNRLMELDVIPIINENDTIATEEIAVGDNDTLAAKVASAVSANILILLSDIDGLYTADPHKHKDAVIIPEVNELNGEITRLATGSLTPQGTGGMITKLNAAMICMENNCEMVITNGNNPDALYDVIDGKQIGTRFRKK